jgi:hypothetical protein
MPILEPRLALHPGPAVLHRCHGPGSVRQSLGMLNEMGALVDATLTVYKVEDNPTTGIQTSAWC